jgi:colanic acid/amylovoran biosynthesis protein
MLIGLFDEFERAGIAYEALVYSYYPERDANLSGQFPHVQVRAGHPIHLVGFALVLLLHRFASGLLPARWRQSAREFTGCDVVCLVGGTTFADSMLYKVPWNTLAAVPAWVARRPFVFLSQTMGPFKRPFNRWLARVTLSRAAAVHGRGGRSTRHVRELGIQGATYRPDLSIGMKVPGGDDAPRVARWLDIARARRSKPDAMIIGVTPNTIVAGVMRRARQDYVALVADVLERIAARGDVPVLIPHSFRAQSRASHNNDTGLCEEILRRCSASAACVYVAEDLTSQELRTLVGELDLLIASRFHSMVSAIAMSTPVITIGWGDQKYLEVLEAFDQPLQYYVPCTKATSDGVMAMVEEIAVARSALAGRSVAAMARNRELLSLTVRELDAFRAVPPDARASPLRAIPP